MKLNTVFPTLFFLVFFAFATNTNTLNAVNDVLDSTKELASHSNPECPETDSHCVHGGLQAKLDKITRLSTTLKSIAGIPIVGDLLLPQELTQQSTSQLASVDDRLQNMIQRQGPKAPLVGLDQSLRKLESALSQSENKPERVGRASPVRVKRQKQQGNTYNNELVGVLYEDLTKLINEILDFVTDLIIYQYPNLLNNLVSTLRNT